MVFNDYKLKEVSQEDAFLGELVKNLDGFNQAFEFFMGEFQALNENDDRRNTKDVHELFEMGSDIFKGYQIIKENITQEWERRGKPLSLRQQEAEKRHYDKLDEEKDYNARY